MHQLANSLIIFDEIQVLPIKCVHLFCNAVNFFVSQCRSSVVLCTATQPLLGQVDSKKGCLKLSQRNEIVPNTQKIFIDLKRVQVKDERKPGGWADDEIADLIGKSVKERGSCLVVVNLKRSAQSLYITLKERNIAECFHLTTGMCPTHRKNVFRDMKKRLKAKNKPIICISTSLIECGVDISFNTVIRYVAGLDSITQASGRCNREKEIDFGLVYIVNPAEEDLTALEDVYIGAKCMADILDDFKERPEYYNYDPIGPTAISVYYQNYFFAQKKKMTYPVSSKEAGRDDSILNLLSSNSFSAHDYKRDIDVDYPLPLPQAFMTAGNIFKVIDAPTESVIVPYGKEGKEVIIKLCGAFNVEKHYELLRTAQQYSVNLYPRDIKELIKKEALMRVQEDTEIYYIDKKYYSEEFGISLEPIGRDGLIYASDS
jgi:CRISPR-associated endonuclease/helicase Cas3